MLDKNDSYQSYADPGDLGPIQKTQCPYGQDVQAALRIEAVLAEHGVRTVAHSTMDGFGHVEDDVGPERLATQPEGLVDLVVLGLDRPNSSQNWPGSTK